MSVAPIACYAIFFDPVGVDFARFASHAHELELALESVPPNGIMVPCSTCRVNNAEYTLTYDVLVEPPSEEGLIETPV